MSVYLTYIVFRPCFWTIDIATRVSRFRGIWYFIFIWNFREINCTCYDLYGVELWFTLTMHIDYVSMLALGHDFKPNPFYLVQLMALLLLRHALSVTDADADDDPSTFFSVSDLSSFWAFG